MSIPRLCGAAAANVARGRPRTDLLFAGIQRKLNHHDQGTLRTAAPHQRRRQLRIAICQGAFAWRALGVQTMTTVPAGETPDASRLLQWMRDNGMPMTRQSYIEAAFGDSRPDPWTRDHEDTLPLHLRDVTKCEPDEQPGD
jgi:hypothetical protein